MFRGNIGIVEVYLSSGLRRIIGERMEFRVLRYFLAVAREGSVSMAAHSLNVTQPTLSRQLKDLEEELKVQLLVRHSHSVSLTPAGMRLRKRAEELTELLEKTKVEFSVGTENIGGEIRIGAGETRGLRHLAGVIRNIRQLHPDIRIHLHSGNVNDVTERLDKGLLDFGIVIQPADITRYDYIHLPEKDVWGVITRRDSLLAMKSDICKQDLLNEPLFLSRQAIRQTAARNTFIEWFGDDFDKLYIVGTFNLVYNAALLAESGIGHVLSIGGLVDTSASSSLCFRLLHPGLRTGLDVVWKKSQIFSPAAGLFLQEMRNAFAYPM